MQVEWVLDGEAWFVLSMETPHLWWQEPYVRVVREQRTSPRDHLPFFLWLILAASPSTFSGKNFRDTMMTAVMYLMGMCW